MHVASFVRSSAETSSLAFSVARSFAQLHHAHALDASQIAFRRRFGLRRLLSRWPWPVSKKRCDSEKNAMRQPMPINNSEELRDCLLARRVIYRGCTAPRRFLGKPICNCNTVSRTGKSRFDSLAKDIAARSIECLSDRFQAIIVARCRCARIAAVRSTRVGATGNSRGKRHRQQEKDRERGDRKKRNDFL